MAGRVKKHPPALRRRLLARPPGAESERLFLGPVEVVQMTGVLARRLVSFVRSGAEGRKGDRFGMIVLGSRVDVLLPAATADPGVSVTRPAGPACQVP